MGGCRCSYRNCKVRSDGQTHMFHFPVFDKMRCHQWITNSHRPNFLNLKLSQLKNRVVCQHHFKDNNFMNFLKDKLKSDAVPTEDGPFCIPSAQTQAMMLEENDKPAIPINADDIENEILDSVEKKAHSSIKYGDFLISDVTELFNSSHNSIDSQTSQKVSSKRHGKNKTNKLIGENAFDSKYKLQKHDEILNYTIIYSNDEPTKPTIPLNSLEPTPNPSLVALEYEAPPNFTESLQNVGLNPFISQPRQCESGNSAVYHSSSAQSINPDKVVKIISEKTISEPVVIEGKLRAVSPSMTIRRPVRKNQNMMFLETDWEVKPQQNEDCKNNDLLASINDVNPLEQVIIFGQTVPIEFAPNNSETTDENKQNVLGNINVDKQSQVMNVDNIEDQNNLNNCDQKQNEIPIEQAFLNCMLESADKLAESEFVSKSKEKQPITPTSSPVYKSILKSKITPEKLAAIEQKRKFNMKLRDVISSCLDNFDKQHEAKIIPEKMQAVKRNLHSKAPSPVSTEGNMVAYLEARLQKMEDTLLNKIDNNTQKINELKRTIKPSKNARHANTQTYLNHMTDESQKEYLYKEISKFLSPNANIKIYEELFLGKTSDDITETSTPRKLRRRR